MDTSLEMALEGNEFDINSFWPATIIKKDAGSTINQTYKEKKISNVSTQLSEHLFAVRHLNKLETANISIYKQNKSNI